MAAVSVCCTNFRTISPRHFGMPRAIRNGPGIKNGPGIRNNHRPVQRSVVVRAVQSSEKKDNAFTSVAHYLSEAAAQIFAPQSTDVPWQHSGYSGKVTHHDVHQLRELYSQVKDVREKVLGCTDPSALNFDEMANADDGTCEYVDMDAPMGQDGGYEDSSLKGYMVGAVQRVFNNNFKGDADSEPKWEHTGYAQSGRSSRRRRDAQRVLTFESIVKKELDNAERKADL